MTKFLYRRTTQHRSAAQCILFAYCGVRLYIQGLISENIVVAGCEEKFLRRQKQYF